MSAGLLPIRNSKSKLGEGLRPPLQTLGLPEGGVCEADNHEVLPQVELGDEGHAAQQFRQHLQCEQPRTKAIMGQFITSEQEAHRNAERSAYQ